MSLPDPLPHRSWSWVASVVAVMGITSAITAVAMAVTTDVNPYIAWSVLWAVAILALVYVVARDERRA
jgi:VIT1/CCC1 family predicted Fe2+/Mn2+ transporter